MIFFMDGILTFAKRFTLDPPPSSQYNVNYKRIIKNLEYCQSVEIGLKKDCFARCVNEKINGENKDKNGGIIVK